MACSASSCELDRAGEGDNVQTRATARRGVVSEASMTNHYPQASFLSRLTRHSGPDGQGAPAEFDHEARHRTDVAWTTAEYDGPVGERVWHAAITAGTPVPLITTILQRLDAPPVWSSGASETGIQVGFSSRIPPPRWCRSPDPPGQASRPPDRPRPG
ncbi:DUF317 domain-containing protein [Streptomyces sp. NPDC002057]|uniref:DUF317 domain-containing protein n=1 Tax=Streptomyces sp. NPDC002057 TaxID=3154664 RepID=UPI00331AD136